MYYNMRKAIVTMAILALSQLLYSQSHSFGSLMGYGVYQLSEIKDYQTQLLMATYITGVESVEQFPESAFYGLFYNYHFRDKNSFGLEANYFSTGGRNHRKDYSGEYKLDMILNGYELGVNYERFFLSYNQFDFSFNIGGGVIISNLKIDEDINASNVSFWSREFEVKSLCSYVKPSFKLKFPLTTQTNLDLKIGYTVNFDYKNEFYYKDDKDIFYISWDKTLRPNWTGLRFSLGISYAFGQDNTEE